MARKDVTEYIECVRELWLQRSDYGIDEWGRAALLLMAYPITFRTDT